MDAAVIPMAVTGPDGRFAYANSALCRMLGYRKEDLEGRSFASLTHPDDVGTSQQKFMDLHAGRIDSFRQRKRYLTRSGQPVWVDLAVAAVRSGDGQVMHFIAQMPNANAHVAAELAATDNVRHLEELLDCAADVVLEMDILGQIQWLSASAARVLGQTVQALQGSNGLALLQLTPGDTTLTDAINTVMTGQRVDGLEVRVRAPDGTEVPLHASLRAQLGPAGEVRFVRVYASVADAEPEVNTDPIATDAYALGKVADFSHMQGGFWLDNTLQQVLRIAQEICGARYAAMQVLEPDGAVGHFLHVGVDGQTIHAIGREPGAVGLLKVPDGQLQPQRYHDLHKASHSVGFPDGHPVFDSFLSVPVALEGRLYAHLYLGDSISGAFSDRDEKHATMLAEMAAPALRNAELLGQATLLSRVADTASSLQVAALNSVSDTELLVSFTGPVRALISADFVAILDTAASPHSVVAVSGAQQFTSAAQDVSMESAEQTLRLVASAACATGDGPLGVGGFDLLVGPWALARIGSTTHSRWIALAGRGIGKQAFTAVQTGMLETLCSRLAFALTFGELRRKQEEYALYQDRERLARDLHDLTIQRIFAVGLILESQLQRESVSAAVVAQAVAELNATITELRQHITSLVDEMQPMSGWELQAATLREAGRCALPADTDLSVDVRVDPNHRFAPDTARAVVAVVREGLSNAASHAHAAVVRVEIDRRNDHLLIQVINDGAAHGPSAAIGRGRGLANLLQRARSLDGDMDIELDVDGWSTLSWWIPYPAQPLHLASE